MTEKNQAGENEEKKLSADEQYDAAWEELEEVKEVVDSGLSDTDPEGKEPNPEDEEELQSEESKLASSNKETLQENTEHVADQTEKRIKDLQAGFTKISQENSELKKKLEAFEAGTATRKEVEDQQKKVDDAKAAINQEALSTVFKEYPELEAILNPLLQTVESLKSETEQFKASKAVDAQRAEEDRKKEALNYFETKVKPLVVHGEDGHPDFEQIITTDDYWEWAEQQRPGLRTAALNSSDPEDIKMALSAYKKDRAMPEAKKLKQQQEEKRQEKLNNAMSLRGGSTQFPAKGKADDNDYDAGWEDAGKLIAKK